MTSGARINPLRGAVVIGAFGVVFGDIGTSPIYTFRECLKAAGDAGNETVLGLLSLVFWALMLVVTIKYVCVVMRADNDGEGGIIALGGLAASVAPDERRRRWVVLIGLAGAALFYGDGMITPAISVLSAVEGLQIATPQLQPYVVPLTVVVLIGLFMVQSRGSGRIGMFFGPIMSVWFLALAVANRFRVGQHQCPLPEIVQDQRGQHEAEPVHADRCPTEMSHIGIKRFGASQGKKHRP